jgi:soluble lytic murein transglycosylase-like protein
MALTNPCGGLRWDMQTDGTVAVDGQGVPVFDQGSLRYRQMEQSWANWGTLILDAASANGIPPQWILAVMCQETGLWSGDAAKQASIVSPDGGVGLMQITDKSLGNPADMLDPATNVAVGSALLGKLARLRDGQLPEIAANYNAGGVRCGASGNPWGMVMSGDYVGNVIRWNNTAVMYLDMAPKPKWLAGLAIGAAGLYAAAVIAGLVMMPRWLRR